MQTRTPRTRIRGRTGRGRSGAARGRGRSRAGGRGRAGRRARGHVRTSARAHTCLTARANDVPDSRAVTPDLRTSRSHTRDDRSAMLAEQARVRQELRDVSAATAAAATATERTVPGRYNLRRRL